MFRVSEEASPSALPAAPAKLGCELFRWAFSAGLLRPTAGGVVSTTKERLTSPLFPASSSCSTRASYSPSASVGTGPTVQPPSAGVAPVWKTSLAPLKMLSFTEATSPGEVPALPLKVGVELIVGETSVLIETAGLTVSIVNVCVRLPTLPAESACVICAVYVPSGRFGPFGSAQELPSREMTIDSCGPTATAP